MDMHSREQYLARVREEYRNADKKTKTRLLNEARRRTRLNRKVLIGKLAHPPELRVEKKRGPRTRTIPGARSGGVSERGQEDENQAAERSPETHAAEPQGADWQAGASARVASREEARAPNAGL